MTAIRGLDYAFSPSGSGAYWASPQWISALKAYQARFVCRYVSPNPDNDRSGKNLLPAEAHALRAAGISVVIVAEQYAQRMLYGRAGGSADALHAHTVTKALGMPGIPVYFAADWDALESQQYAINAYLDGAAAIIGRPRVGVYGGYHVVRRTLDAGKAAFAWQTIAWSGGQWDHRAHIRQGLQIKVGGASVDPDTGMFPDYGQWPRPAAPAPAPAPAPVQEEDKVNWLPNAKDVPVVWVNKVIRLRFLGTVAEDLRLDWMPHPNDPHPGTSTVHIEYAAAEVTVPVPEPDTIRAVRVVRGVAPVDGQFPVVSLEFLR